MRRYNAADTRHEGISRIGITIVAADSRSSDCSLRSLLFYSAAAELGRYAHSIAIDERH